MSVNTCSGNAFACAPIARVVCAKMLLVKNIDLTNRIFVTLLSAEIASIPTIHVPGMSCNECLY